MISSSVGLQSVFLDCGEYLEGRTKQEDAPIIVPGQRVAFLLLPLNDSAGR